MCVVVTVYRSVDLKGVITHVESSHLSSLLNSRISLMLNGRHDNSLHVERYRNSLLWVFFIFSDSISILNAPSTLSSSVLSKVDLFQKSSQD